MKSLELEIRSYIIVFGLTFMVVFLNGCGQTVQGVGKDIMELGQSVVDMGKEEKKSD